MTDSSTTERKPGKLNTSFFEAKIAEQTAAAEVRKPAPGKLSDRAALFNTAPVAGATRQNSSTSDADIKDTGDAPVDKSQINRTPGKLTDRAALFTNSPIARPPSVSDADSATTAGSVGSDAPAPRKIGRLNVDLAGLNATLAQGPKMFGTGPRKTPVDGNNDTVRTFATNVVMTDGTDQPYSSPAPDSGVADRSDRPHHSRTMSGVSTSSSVYINTYPETPQGTSTDTPRTDSVAPLHSKTITRATVNRSRQRKLPSAMTAFVAPVVDTPTAVVSLPHTEPINTTAATAEHDLPAGEQIAPQELVQPIADTDVTTSKASTLADKRPTTIRTGHPPAIPQHNIHARNDTFAEIDSVLDTIHVNDVTPQHTAHSSMSSVMDPVASPIPLPPAPPSDASDMDTPTPRQMDTSPTPQVDQPASQMPPTEHIRVNSASSTSTPTSLPADSPVQTDKQAQKARLEGLLRAGPPVKHQRNPSTSSIGSDDQPTTAPVQSTQPLQSYLPVTRPHTLPGISSRNNSISIVSIPEQDEQMTSAYNNVESPVSVAGSIVSAQATPSTNTRPPPLPVQTFQTNIHTAAPQATTPVHTPPPHPHHHQQQQQSSPVKASPPPTSSPAPQPSAEQMRAFRQHNGYDEHRAQHYMDVLRTGMIVTLHQSKHKPMQCSLFASSSGFLFCSDAKTKSTTDTLSLYIGYIKQIICSNQHDFWHHKKTKDVDARLCMSVLADDKQMHIQMPTQEARAEMFEALMYARQHVNELQG